MAMTERYGIFFNKQAGSGESLELAHQLKGKLESIGAEVIFLTADTPEKAVELIYKEMDHLDTIVSIGGDGTLNSVGTAFIRKGYSIPVGIIPGGTINNFAKRFGISMDMMKAMDTILSGRLKKVSIGKCANQAIISSFTLGELADISNEVRQSEKRKYGLIVYPMKALKKIGKRTAYPIDYTVNGKNSQFKTWVTLVTTTSSVGGVSYTKDQTDAFHVSVLNNITVSKIVSYLKYAFTGELRGKNGITYFNATEIKLAPANQKQRITTRIDGDEGPNLPLTLTWQKEFLTILVPNT